MNERTSSTEIGCPTARRSFGATLLDALYESRRRHAALEIHKYRHLVDNARSYEQLRAMKPPARMDLGKAPAVHPGIERTQFWSSCMALMKHLRAGT